MQMRLAEGPCLAPWRTAAPTVPSAAGQLWQRGALSPFFRLIEHCQASATLTPESIPCRAFADSKTLTEEKREALFQEIAEDAGMRSAVDVLCAQTISAQMLHTYVGVGPAAWGTASGCHA